MPSVEGGESDRRPAIKSCRNALQEISLNQTPPTSSFLPSVTPYAPERIQADAEEGFLLEPRGVLGHEAPLSLSVGSAEAASLSAKFPLTCDSKIHLSLFGEIITCDLKTLGPDPAVIIQLLKMTQSERANYMIVGASYRRSGFPKSAKAIMETMIEELRKRGVSESELKPAYLFLAGCESDLIRLSKATKNSARTSEHYAAAQMWLQKVFGKANAANNHDENKENRFLEGRKPRLLQTVAPISDKDNVGRLTREIQVLRDQNAQQTQQLVRLRSSKRKIEEDYYYERNLRRKYENHVDSIQAMGIH